MSLARVHNWAAAEVLTASDLNAEFNNILNNALSLISPLTASLDVNNFRLTNFILGSVTAPSISFQSDANTGIFSTAADTVDITAGGVESARFSTAAVGVNFFKFVPSATTASIDMQAAGSDTDISMKITPKGAGTVTITGLVGAFNLVQNQIYA